MQGFGTDFTLSLFMNKQPNCQLDDMNKQFNDMNKMYVDGVYSGISVSLAAVNWLMVLLVLQQYGNRIYQNISLAMTMPLIETMVVYFRLIYIYIYIYISYHCFYETWLILWVFLPWIHIAKAVHLSNLYAVMRQSRLRESDTPQTFWDH